MRVEVKEHGGTGRTKMMTERRWTAGRWKIAGRTLGEE